MYYYVFKQIQKIFFKDKNSNTKFIIKGNKTMYKLKIYKNVKYISRKIPVLILINYDDTGDEIFEKARKKIKQDFVLAVIYNINWDKDLSPWKIEKINKYDNFEGGADNFSRILNGEILEKIRKETDNNIKELILCGYSLAGLFSLYEIYKVGNFSKIVCASASFWYPNFIDFIKQHEPVIIPKKIYFSLGNKESNVKNEILNKVEENTIFLSDYYKKFNIETKYDINEGNHFYDVTNRIVKGIEWILK